MSRSCISPGVMVGFLGEIHLPHQAPNRSCNVHEQFLIADQATFLQRSRFDRKFEVGKMGNSEHVSWIIHHPKAD